MSYFFITEADFEAIKNEVKRNKPADNAALIADKIFRDFVKGRCNIYDSLADEWEDIIQRSELKTIKGINKFFSDENPTQTPQTFSAWLRTIIKNEMVDTLKSVKRIESNRYRMKNDDEDDENDPYYAAPSHDLSPIDRIIVKEEVKDCIFGAVCLRSAVHIKVIWLGVTVKILSGENKYVREACVSMEKENKTLKEILFFCADFFKRSDLDLKFRDRLDKLASELVKPDADGVIGDKRICDFTKEDARTFISKTFSYVSNKIIKYNKKDGIFPPDPSPDRKAG